MKCTSMGVMAFMLIAARIVPAQCDDPYDDVLCAHALTSGQVEQFSATDNQVSPFWAELGGDRIELIAPDNCVPGNCGFQGTDDAAVLIKAGVSSMGLYLYVEVQDNTWVDRTSAEACCDDSADLYFDKLSANEIATCTGCLIGLYSSTLTYSTNQIQVSMGSLAPPQDFRFAYYDENLWSWQTISLTSAQSAELYGLQVEVITVTATRKVQEWFFPWESFGGGFTVGTNLSDSRVGFAGGYNDKDGDNPDPDKLRWPRAGDPWAADAQTVNYWGDILIPDGIVVEALSVRDAPRAMRGNRAAQHAGAEVARFSLAGQRLHAERALSAGVSVEHVVSPQRGAAVYLRYR